MKLACIIVAAGSGTRMGGSVPKQYMLVGSRSILAMSVSSMLAEPRIEMVHCIIQPQDIDKYRESILTISDPRLCEPVSGGESRTESVYKGLSALENFGFTHVLVHDAVRPFAGPSVITRVIDALKYAQAVSPVLPVVDTLWKQAESTYETIPRENLARAQTPQGFDFAKILAAHKNNHADAPDDIAIALAAGLSVNFVEGSEDNYKITRPVDMERAKQSLPMDIRVGTGFDVHAFVPGTEVILCGVPIAHTHKLSGHSDADVAMHAITDAIFGALAQGDIGRWFPPTEAQWKDADSAIFLQKAVDLAAQANLKINHIDCTIICEMPKIGPHANAMGNRIAQICGIAVDCVSIKATTTERLGFTGRKEGIAAMANATLVSK